MKKKITTINLDPIVLKKAKELMINISQSCEDHLRELVNCKGEVLEAITFCNLCKKTHQKEKMIFFDPYAYQIGSELIEKHLGKHDEDLSKYYFVCNNCFWDVHNLVPNKNIDEKFAIPLLKTITNEKKRNEKSNTTIFDDLTFGLYEGVAGNFDSEATIKYLLQEINDHPHVQWIFVKGMIAVHWKQLNPNWDD